MKKTLRILLFLALVFILVACSGEDENREITDPKRGEEFVLYQQKKTGVEINTYLFHKAQIVSRQVTVSTIDAEEAGMDLEVLKSRMEEVKKSYDGVKGVTYNANVEGNKIDELLELDYTKADLEELRATGLVNAPERVDSVGLPQTEELLETMGYTKIK